MSPPSPTVPEPFFLPLASPAWKSYGLPGRTTAYEQSRLGLLNLIKSPTGRVGVTRAEAERYFADMSQPLRDSKRDHSAATAASVAGRRVA